MTASASFDPIAVSDSLDVVVRGLRQVPETRHDPNDNFGPTGSPARALGSLFARWADAVGPGVADHARPIKLDGSRLLVEVDEPGWATQLKFLEHQVIDRLRAVAGLEVSRFDVRVKQR